MQMGGGRSVDNIIPPATITSLSHFDVLRQAPQTPDLDFWSMVAVLNFWLSGPSPPRTNSKKRCSQDLQEITELRSGKGEESPMFIENADDSSGNTSLNLEKERTLEGVDIQNRAAFKGDYSDGKVKWHLHSIFAAIFLAALHTGSQVVLYFTGGSLILLNIPSTSPGAPSGFPLPTFLLLLLPVPTLATHRIFLESGTLPSLTHSAFALDVYYWQPPNLSARRLLEWHSLILVQRLGSRLV
ncbi:hypothetical protein K469DRAFT_745081 [Zopfia rhizophila CBS 207.26]|uniref:Uncharacterized protein n=1 Tax=Zopfia rhizophila CBS 207.26 TaxID=1314779 RepID=A0A6A6EQD2_9PEZI|nr:hypothetical protein K469DRAFT_745081 [Zopfia rhizophila CBS 207.26]